MSEYLAFDPTLYLEHYGVKGMRWGVRRVKNRISNYRSSQKKLNEPNKRYSEANREKDRYLLGRSGVKRINKRLNKGYSYKKAIRREYGSQVIRGFVSAGLVSTSLVLSLYGEAILKTVIQSREARRGAREAARLITKIGAGSVVNLKRSQYSII